MRAGSPHVLGSEPALSGAKAWELVDGKAGGGVAVGGALADVLRGGLRRPWPNPMSDVDTKLSVASLFATGRDG